MLALYTVMVSPSPNARDSKMLILWTLALLTAVSYTHLDVYKRQEEAVISKNTSSSAPALS